MSVGAARARDALGVGQEPPPGRDLPTPSTPLARALADLARGARMTTLWGRLGWQDVRRRCRVGVLGGNGAGKTTLLRVLAGVYEPTAGTVWAAGRIGSRLDVMLGFDPEATGRETIVTCGLLAGLTLAEVRERAGEIGEFTELGDYLGMPVNTYSTGMRFRLGFAVCTSFEPDILLIDEWTAVGNRGFLDKAYRRLEAFADGLGIVVLAAQDPELVRRVCATAIPLDAGRVQACGSVAEVLAKAARVRGTGHPGEGARAGRSAAAGARGEGARHRRNRPRREPCRARAGGGRARGRAVRRPVERAARDD